MGNTEYRKKGTTKRKDGWMDGDEACIHGLIEDDKLWRKFWVKENHCMVKKFFGVSMKINKNTRERN